MKNRVAIIMRSKNEMPYIEASLESLHNQTFKDFKLYNIDSGSTDGGFEVIKKWNKNPETIFQIKPEDYVPGVVMNKMIANTAEDIVVLLNSDAIPMDDMWLNRLVEPLLTNQADATMARQIPRKDAYFIVKYDYARAYDPEHIRNHPNFFSVVGASFKRTLWEETPFYTGGYTEDALWCKMCREKGARFLYVPEAVVEHSHNYTLSELYRRKFIDGDGEVLLGTSKVTWFGQCYLCCRELVRDLLYTISRGVIWTIPYNIVYRIVSHKGLYDGKKEALKKVNSFSALNIKNFN